MAKVKTCLWFKNDAEEAARRYVELVPRSHVDLVQLAPGDWPAGKEGQVILVEFTLAGQAFQGLNGGSRADYGTCASIAVELQTQDEIDRLWDGLLADGGQALACGWVRDRWGVPWQVYPEILPRLFASEEPNVARRAFEAMSQMVKLDIAAIEKAAKG